MARALAALGAAERECVPRVDTCHAERRWPAHRTRPFPPPTVPQPPGEAPSFGLRFGLAAAAPSRALGPKPSLAPSQNPVARSRGLVGLAQPHGLVTAGVCCAWWTRTAAPPQPRPQRRCRRHTCAARSAEAVAGGMRAWRRTRWSGSQRRRRGLCQLGLLTAVRREGDGGSRIAGVACTLYTVQLSCRSRCIM